MKMIKWSKQSWQIGEFEEVEIAKVTDTNVYLPNGKRLAIETVEFDCYAPTLEEAKARQIKHWQGKVAGALGKVADAQKNLDKACGHTSTDEKCMHCAIGNAVQAHIGKFPDQSNTQVLAHAMGKVLRQAMQGAGINMDNLAELDAVMQYFFHGANVGFLPALEVTVTEGDEKDINHPGTDTRN